MLQRFTLWISTQKTILQASSIRFLSSAGWIETSFVPKIQMFQRLLEREPEHLKDEREQRMTKHIEGSGLFATSQTINRDGLRYGSWWNWQPSEYRKP